MAVLRVNAAADGTLALARAPGGDWREVLAQALAAVPRDKPVTILIHGYRYSWRAPRAGQRGNPHNSLYLSEALPECRRTKPCRANWPHALGFSEHAAEDGLCIAFSWEAWARFAGPRCFAEVHRRAGRTGRALIRLVREIGTVDPGRRVTCLTHSLGARVVIQALSRAPRLAIEKAILLGAAEYAAEARAMLADQDAVGARTEFCHVLARANDLFDLLFTWFAPYPAARGDRPLGVAGLGRSHPRWLDLQIDHPDVRAWLAEQGLPPERPSPRVSHWGFYADPGAMRLYRAILRDRARWTLPAMAARGVPRDLAPCWSRLVPSLGWQGGDKIDLSHEADFA